MTARGCAVLAALLSIATAGAVRAAEEAGSKEDKQAAGRAGDATLTSGTGATIDASDLSKQPKLTRPAKVTYPLEAVGKSNGDVEVTLLVDLDEKGEVTGATVVEPKTPTGLGFEEAAVTAAYSLGFEPAEIAGKPTPISITYTFKFPLPKPAAPPPPPPATPVPVAAPKPPPVENFVGVLRERGTRIPMAGILVTVYRSGEAEPVGFENITDAKGQFHSSARNLEGLHRAPRLLSFPYHRGDCCGRGDTCDLLCRAGLVQSLRQSGHCRARAQGGQPHGD